MDNAMWAFGRMSGFVALALFTLTVLLGILHRSGRPLAVLPRFSITLLHRNTALLGSLFLVMHIGSLMLDSYARLTVTDLLLPFLGSFKPFWQGLGTVALDLIIAVTLTGMLHRHIGQRTFRAIHWFSYLMWPLALAHALGNGTEGTSRWFLVLAAVSAATVGAAGLWRLSTNFLETAKSRQGARS